jgi:hypothetical protein
MASLKKLEVMDRKYGAIRDTVFKVGGIWWKR